MYLSRLMLNPHHRRTQSELARPYEMHRTIMSAFPGDLPEGERVLYRVEMNQSRELVMVLVQSQNLPDWRGLVAVPRYLTQEPEQKQVHLNPKEGQVLAFRLHANPTVKKKSHEKGDGPRRNGIRVGLSREEDQRAWLDRKGALHGFEVLKALILPGGLQVGYKKDSTGDEESTRRLAHLAVTFEGLLRVTDPLLLNKSVQRGIGSGKSLGFGLLSLASPKVTEQP